MTEWFKCNDEFVEKTKVVWGKKGEKLINCAKKWKDEKAVETQLEKKKSFIGRTKKETKETN